VADPKLELREVTDGFRTLTRRLQLREQQLTDLARQLRRAARQPMFEAPVGDRSRRFVDAQARRLETLARRLQELRVRLDRVQGTVRPHPGPGPAALLVHVDPAFHGGSQALDWSDAEVGIKELIARCPPPHHGEWEAVGADDDPDLADRPSTRPRPIVNSHGPAWFKPLPPVRPLERPWRLDLTAIRQMTKQLRTLGDRIEDVGQACRRDFDDPSGRMPAALREAIDRAGLSSGRVCADVDRRLRRHAAAVDKKMATPGLLGPGPQYGLSAFGIDQQLIGLDLDVEAAFVALRDAGDTWHDRVRELTAIMEWLCRRLPVVFGTPAEAFFDLVGITDTSPPPDRPPGTLPPIRYPLPPDLAAGGEVIVDPATSLSMTRAEYYQRYGVRFGEPLPEPLSPLPADTPGDEDTSTSGVGVGAVAAGAIAGGVAGAATGGRSRTDDDEDEDEEIGVEDEAGVVVRHRPSAPSRAGGTWEGEDDGSGAGVRTDAGSAGRSGDTDDLSGDGSPVSSAGDVVTATEGPSQGAAVGSDAPAPAGSAPTSTPTGSTSSAVPADPQLAADVAVAVRRGGVRVTQAGGAVLGAVIVGGASAGAAVNKKNAAKKITNWMQYKARRKASPEAPRANA
jgi:hypothetical protein